MSSDQVGGDTQERHGSLQVITVPVVTRSVEDIIMNIEGHASSVTDTECVLEVGADTERQRLAGAGAPHTPQTWLRARGWS